jgi:hypothetical protein
MIIVEIKKLITLYDIVYLRTERVYFSKRYKNKHVKVHRNNEKAHLKICYGLKDQCNTGRPK